MFQVFLIPDFITNFFLTFGDKFEPHKGSDLTLLFVISFMLNGKFFRNNKNYYGFLIIFSALYLPFLYFKSRASFIAIFIFLIYEIGKNRKVVFNQVPFLLSDTVGFIRKLPHQLVESFKSTLDEVREADVLVHVVDLSHPSHEEHMAVVEETLNEIIEICKNIKMTN